MNSLNCMRMTSNVYYHYHYNKILYFSLNNEKKSSSPTILNKSKFRIEKKAST